MQTDQIFVWPETSTWYEKITKHLLKLNFNHYDLDDVTLFINIVGKTIILYVVVYVDYLLVTRNNDDLISHLGDVYPPPNL